MNHPSDKERRTLRSTGVSSELDTDALDGVSSELEAAPAAAQHIGWNDRPHGPNYPVESVPTISPAMFEKWLRDHHSPILQEADALAYYRAIMDRGINPAFALAFFHHESTDATDPEGVVVRYGTKNWGNLRPAPGGGLGRAVRSVQTEWGPFRVYRTYMDGLLDWCDLMLGPLYRGKSVPAALQTYAPATDNNDPNRYANIVLGLVAQWDQQSGDFAIPGAGGAGATGATTDAGGAATTPAPDFPLLGPPTIPVDTFTQTLAAAHSPALDEAAGADYFSLCVSSGVDPAVALAFFQQESNYGAASGAAEHKNWGNLWDPQANAIQTYPSWRAGLADWCHRLQGPAYTAHGAPTLSSIVPIYQPAGARLHGNGWYIAQLAGAITRLQTAPRVAEGTELEAAAPLEVLAGREIGVEDRPHGPDYPIVSVPTISPSVFAAVLEGYQSPALGEASALDYYRTILGTGINPAVALAVFEHETHCGTDRDSATVQAGARNWANLHPRLDGSLGRAVRAIKTPSGAFRGYDSYLAGLLDWAEIMLGRPYQGKRIGAALRMFAPQDDQDPNSYGNAVLRQIAAWDAASGVFTIPGAGSSTTLESAGPGLEAAPALEIEWAGASSANYWQGRQGHTPIAITNHEMQGTMAGTRAAFWDPGHQASAHYGVGQDGQVVQFVKEADAAWANGPIRNPNADVAPWIAEAARNGTNPNTLTISIEWEGSHDGQWTKVTWAGKEYDNIAPGSVTRWFTPTAAQYQAGLALIRAIAARWNIPFDRAHICRHSDVDSVTKWFCPGNGFPLQRVLDDLQGTTRNADQGATDEQQASAPPDFALLGPASISADTFTQALTAAHSPALDEAAGADYYNLCVNNGIDPAVALAFFQQESNYGAAPGAAERKNWGNLWDPQANAVQTYSSWRAGLADWCHRLQGPAYTAHGAPTLSSIVPIYQPAGARAHGNDWYIGRLRDTITRLRTG